MTRPTQTTSAGPIREHRIATPGSIPTQRMSDGTGGTTQKSGGPRTPKRSTNHGAGRYCTDCTRPLSRYNPDTRCASCFQMVPVDQRPSVRV